MLDDFLKVSALVAPLRKAVKAHYSDLAKLRADVESGAVTQTPGIGEGFATQLETAFLAWDQGEFDTGNPYEGHGVPADEPDEEPEPEPEPEPAPQGTPKRPKNVTREGKKINWDRLSEPFDKGDIEWKPVKLPFEGRGNNKRKIAGKALYVPYITNRAVMDRLDEVFGIAGWQNRFTSGPDGGVMCSIGVQTESGEWIWKNDGGENTAIEAVKGGFSVSMRRTAVQYGIGRYLYSAPANWIDVDANHKPRKEPRLPDAFLPDPDSDEDWANADFHRDPNDMVDEEPAPARQRTQNRRQAAPPSDEGPSKGELSERLYGRSTRPPKPRKSGSNDLQTGDWPHFPPLVENWTWAMPDGSRRQDTAGVSKRDLDAFMKRARKFGWDSDAAMLMLSDIFGAEKFSDLMYAQMCGAWQILGYRGAFDLYQSEAEKRRGGQRQQRSQPRQQRQQSDGPPM